MPWTQPTTGWQSPVRCLIFLLAAVPLWAQLTITTFSLSPASVNVPYMQTLAATGGTGLLVWSTVSPLPTGVLLPPVGILAGIPTTQIGSPFSITARVQDSALPNPNSVTKQLSLIVNQPIITTSSPLSVASLNTGYHFQLAAGGGTGNYSNWQIIGGLPPSLSINNNTDSLHGVPTSNIGHPF